MARPHPDLIDLAAGREPRAGEVDGFLLRSAVEHRMPGILHSWADRGGMLNTAWGRSLVGLDADIWARNRLLLSTASALIEVASQVHLQLAVIKGVALEAMAYQRMGERPSGDIDLVAAPGMTRAIVDFVYRVQPAHPWLPHLEGLLDRGQLQSIDLVVNGIPVDLHVDPLKLEVAATRHPDVLWGRLTKVTIDGNIIPTFDLDASLTLALLHLNKDRFSHLIGYADVVRLWRGDTDWGWIESFARGEALLTALSGTLEAVISDLAIPDRAGPLPSASRMWEVLWPERIRLRGAEGRVRWRYRQMFIPVLGTGRVREVAASWVRRVFPPSELLDLYYPKASGPYPWRLIANRLRSRLARRRLRRTSITSQSSSGSEASDLRT